MSGEKMNITEKQLALIMPGAGERAVVFAPLLNVAMARRQINTPRRVAAFLAQIGHESGQLRHVRELGGQAYLAKYDTGPLAERLGNTTKADGDGQRYRGRGLIQITGLKNYQVCSVALFGDQRLISDPSLLEQPEWAAESAAWFWWVRELNALADRGDFAGITKRINGGQNGIADRRALWLRAVEVLA